MLKEKVIDLEDKQRRPKISIIGVFKDKIMEWSIILKCDNNESAPLE